MSRPEDEYREFAGSRAASLHRTAYLLCGDWHLANDLVQETFVQTFRHWRRVQRADNQNAYVKRILINEFKRHWQRYGGLPVRAGADHPEVAVPDVSDAVVDRADLLRALLTLPARQRATVVLRYLEGMSERETATYAVTGDLDTAALKMAWPVATPVPAWLSAQVKNMSVGGIQIDNYVWENCEDSLVAGSGNPQVRAGVLRLVSALPGITVTHGTVDGQPTLTLTAGAAELGNVGIDKANPKADTGPAYQEAITINADTGIPLEIASGPAGQVTGTVTYVVTRVNLADIAAGKF